MAESNVERYKIQIENEDGTKVFYPHTTEDVVFDENGINLEEKMMKLYTKDEVDDKIVDFAKKTDVYTKEQTNTMVSAKQNKVLFGTTPPTNDMGVDGDIYIQIEA